MTTVLLADDHPFIRTGVAAVLENSPFRLIATAASGDEALSLVASHDPDIVVLDVRMPGRDGVETLRALRAMGDGRPVVLLTAQMEDSKLVDAMAAGVQGIVLKEGAESSLLACLQVLASGGTAIPDELSRHAAELVRSGGGTSPFDSLSHRELMLARYVASGLRNRAIAERLGTSEGAVKVSLHTVYAKLGVASRTELTILAHHHGFELGS